MKILIAGISKTGTTGLLYLVANSLKKEPRLLFEPNVCPPDVHGDPGDVVAKVLIGANLRAETFSHFEKKITLVRDPRDRMVSRLLYSQFSAGYLKDDECVRQVMECLIRKERDPSSVSILDVLEIAGRAEGKQDAVSDFVQGSKRSHGFFDDYFSSIRDSVLYYYEDFVSGKYSLLEEYLGMPLMGEAEVPDAYGRVNRTKGSGDWRNWFTEEDVLAFRPLFSPWLERYGYDPEDWALNASPVIRSEHCSEYYLRLVNERRRRG